MWRYLWNMHSCSQGVADGMIKVEEANDGAATVHPGNTWHKSVQLVQHMRDIRHLPEQMTWVITVLIPMRGGDYWGIGLLEPIRKTWSASLTNGWT